MPYWEIALYSFGPLVLIGLTVGVVARKLASLIREGRAASP